MGKHIVYTKITPLPSNVPRQLALDLLHSHDEVIKMNPLVTEVKSIDPPRTAAADEFFSNWYQITEIITWGFGLKKKIQFHGVFHDQPWGMQSHVYAPLNTDMRQTYRIGGNQPGEPPEPKELGVDTPASGLYLREDVNVKVSTPLVGSFVQKEMKDSSKVMIDRIVRKAELLDEGKLHAMFEKGKLKTAKPSGEATYSDRPLPSPGSPPASSSPGTTPETYHSAQFKSPNVDSKGFGRYSDIAPDRSASVRSSQQYLPAYQQAGYKGPDFAQTGAELPGGYVGQQQQQQNFVSELPGSYYQPQSQNNLAPAPLRPSGNPMAFRAEMMGDTTFLHPQRTPPLPHQQNGQEAQHPQQAPPGGYQAYQRSPQGSPRLPPGSPRMPSTQSVPSRHSSQSSYQVTNPDQPPAGNRSSSYSNNVEQWQRNVQSDAPIDDNYYRNSRNSHAGGQVEPDFHRFSNLSIQQNVNDSVPEDTRSAKCPVCGLFEVCNKHTHIFWV